MLAQDMKNLRIINSNIYMHMTIWRTMVRAPCKVVNREYLLTQKK